MTFFDFVDKYWDEIMKLVNKVLDYLKGLNTKDDEETPAE